MNFSGNNSIQNNVFDGSYSIFINPVDKDLESFWLSKGINPTGIVAAKVFYSAGDGNTESGAYPSGFGSNLKYISGASDQGTASGFFYYRASNPLFGVCHGIGSDSGVWLTGYNFYNAFHPEGYIAPPFGQNISTFLEKKLGIGALYEVGGCTNLNTTEYNDIFGISSETDPGISASTDDFEPKADAFINSPAIACPQDLSVAYYFREKQYKLIAGTASAITANTFFNINPIPTSLDMFNNKVKFRYDSIGTKLGDLVRDEEGVNVEKIRYDIKYDGNKKPIPKYSKNQGRNLLSTPTCLAFFAEGKLYEDKLTNSLLGSTQVRSLLLDSPDILGSPAKSLFDFFVWWNSWHFLFQENSDGFPFTNDYKLASKDTPNVDYVGVAKTPNTANYGSQLFKAELSSPDHYWENRQCPAVVDFLPYTFGGAIYACPSYHFDIPYYAAINKFGFYGTRFLNGCLSLQFEYPSSGGIPNAQELPSEGYSYTYPEEEEPDDDKPNFSSDEDYDNLLKIAKSEEAYNDFFALNKMLFIWSNIDLLKESYEFLQLKNKYPTFPGLLQNFLGEFYEFFPNGKEALITNNNYFLSVSNAQASINSKFEVTGDIYSLLSKNNNYKLLLNSINKLLKPEDKGLWKEIEKRYSNTFLDKFGAVDTGFYYRFETGKIARLQSRYFENYIQGNPIDLYPSNKITFSYDKAIDFIDSPSWGKLTTLFGNGTKFEDSGLIRRYFVGAYGESSDFDGYSNYLNEISQIKNSYFYPGFFNSIFGNDIPKTDYIPVITGNIFTGQSFDKMTIKNGQNPLSQGWLAVGYNGIQKLRGSYSCFTPIFVQQPLNTVHCKIGQSPTFRAFAVDYHTIPEDKINRGYPEIMYWSEKLKLVDSKGRNKYKIKYKWYRIKKSYCQNDFKNFIKNGYFSVKYLNDFYHDENAKFPVEPSNVTGTWCCFEGDSPDCTLIHPKECVPVFNRNSSYSYETVSNSSYDLLKRNNFYMKFKKGAIEGVDDDYYYFCVVKGRFGIRISEPSELFIDNNLQFDISVQNGGNASFNMPISFYIGGESGNISVPSLQVNKYQGFDRNNSYIPEKVVEFQIPPPNKGWGDVYSCKFVGSWGYGGALQSYTPGTLNDTRGLRETWGRFLHYGSLTKYQLTLTQEQGDALYGKNHLPVCQSGNIVDDQIGIRLDLAGVETNEAGEQIGLVHWANMQNPIVSTNGRRGVLWNKLGNAGELYNPVSNGANGIINDYISPGLGQWQWGNNLGTIHRFGYNSDNSLLTTTPGKLTDQEKQKLKDKLLINTLDGETCGWNKYGLGRNMLYWIEGFSSFYIFCDPLKKKNVTNYNYMSPALRHTNSSIQYFWLGKPSNCHLRRYSMYGPYAYQWKVSRHNRDRNGNGMSEAFYSYGWGINYSLMYDAPAIYGLFRRYGSLPSSYIEEISAARAAGMGESNILGVQNTRFGFTYGNGGARRYGNIWIGNIKETGEDRYTKLREYVKSGMVSAQNLDFYLYGCHDSDLKNGDCFDPCISIRYANGFLPGGKQQELTTANGRYHIVANNITSGSGKFFAEKTQFLSGENFRGPFGTPHHKYLKSIGKNLNGFSPCFDGGADHCNYMTPTINIGASSYLETTAPTFLTSVNQANSLINFSLPEGI